MIKDRVNYINSIVEFLRHIPINEDDEMVNTGIVNDNSVYLGIFRDIPIVDKFKSKFISDGMYKIKAITKTRLNKAMLEGGELISVGFNEDNTFCIPVAVINMEDKKKAGDIVVDTFKMNIRDLQSDYVNTDKICTNIDIRYELWLEEIAE